MTDRDRPSSAGESASQRGERRRAIERERRIYLETGQMPRVVDLTPGASRSEPPPDSRRARRLAEQGTGAIPVTSYYPEDGDRTTSILPVIRPPLRSPGPDPLRSRPSPSNPPPSWQDALRTAAAAGQRSRMQPLPHPPSDLDTRVLRRPSDGGQRPPEVASRRREYPRTIRTGGPLDPPPGAAPPPLGAEPEGFEFPRHRPGTALLLLLGAALVALVVVLGVLRFGGGPERTAATDPGRASPAQRTLLVVLDGGGGRLAATALMAFDARGAVSVLVPGNVLVDTPGSGRRPFAESMSESPLGPARALSDVLQVRIDGTWRLSTGGLAQLVDLVGGVVVDVEREIASGPVLVAAGDGQRLAGAQAAAVASTLVSGEPEEERLARFQAVMAAVLAGLPEDETKIADDLTRLGSDSSVEATGMTLAPTLRDLHQRVRIDGIRPYVLPVRAITAGDTTVLGLDETQVEALVSQQLRGARLAEPPGGTIRVLVQNGAKVPGLSDAARERLVNAGMRFVAGGNAQQFGHSTTTIMVPGDSAENRARGVRVAKALGVSPDGLAIDPLGSGMADVVVVLGKDFADDVTDRGVLPTGTATPFGG